MMEAKAEWRWKRASGAVVITCRLPLGISDCCLKTGKMTFPWLLAKAISSARSSDAVEAELKSISNACGD